MFDESKLNKIPEHMKQGVVNYVELGYRPGSFLNAVLGNDLATAGFYADDYNRNAWREWADVLDFVLPKKSWGSAEIVNAWIEHNGLEGLE